MDPQDRPKAPVSEASQKAFSDWLQEIYQRLGRHALERKAIPESADGRCVWAIPHRILLAKYWPKNDEANAVWVIGGEVPMDLLPISAAAKAREAARHFSLKWQLEGGQISEQATRDGAAQDWAGVGDNFAASAESLYALADNDLLWKDVKE